jgi:trehalose/maltose transport system permease protein
MSKTLRHRVQRVGFYVLLAIIVVYLMFPFYWAIRSSITPNSEMFTTPLTYWPHDPTLDFYREVFSDRLFMRSILNSAIVAGSVTVISLVIGAFASFALGRFSFSGRTPVLYIILAMTMFPQIAILYNTLPALIITYLLFTLPFTVWVLTTFFQTMPRELEEAAYVDGATPFQVFWKVLLPLAAPGLVTTGLLAFIAAWNEFLYALSFIQSPENRTITLAIFTFNTNTTGGFELPWGKMMAGTVIVTLPLIILTIIFQRRIVQGLTAGAVKG